MNKKRLVWFALAFFSIASGGVSLSALIDFPYFFIPIFFFAVALLGIYKFGEMLLIEAYEMGKLEGNLKKRH